MKKLAILITSYNRKDKTIACLDSFFNADMSNKLSFNIYLVDDGSTDNTSLEVHKKYPKINIIKSKGNLFWAGGMRLAWKTALKSNHYDAFLLLNDDVRLMPDFFENIIKTHKYSLKKHGSSGIYVCSTINKNTGKVSYGGVKVKNNILTIDYKNIIPTDKPVNCDMANANILFVTKKVVDKIGILDDKFIHGEADYDYSLLAKENKIPVLLCPNIGGYCENDHGNNWAAKGSTFSERLDYLYSPKGLAYKEHLYFIKRHYPFSLPYAFIMLWLKTIFPSIWDNFKTAKN